jgi:hypothetical protein
MTTTREKARVALDGIEVGRVAERDEVIAHLQDELDVWADDETPVGIGKRAVLVRLIEEIGRGEHVKP